MAVTPALAGEVDQVNQAPASFGYGISSQSWPFQAFTPSVTGELDQVDVPISTISACSAASPKLQIRTANGGLPTGNVLAADSELDPVGPDHSARFARPATLTAGRSYAIVATAPEECYFGWNAAGADPYPGGDGGASDNGGASWYVFNDTPRTDFIFTTYMVRARCGGKDAQLIGTHGADKLAGAAKRDVALGYRGRDTVRGLRGNDLICGAEGNDTLIGGPGKDTLIGGPGRDTCIGGPGRDILRSCEVRRTR